MKNKVTTFLLLAICLYSDISFAMQQQQVQKQQTQSQTQATKTKPAKPVDPEKAKEAGREAEIDEKVKAIIDRHLKQEQQLNTGTVQASRTDAKEDEAQKQEMKKHERICPLCGQLSIHCSADQERIKAGEVLPCGCKDCKDKAAKADAKKCEACLASRPYKCRKHSHEHNWDCSACEAAYPNSCAKHA